MKPTRIRKLRFQMMAAVGVVLGLIWSAVGYQLEKEREAAVRLAMQNGENLAGIVAGHFATTVDLVDVLLKRLRGEWLDRPGHFPEVVAAASELRKDTFPYRIVVTDVYGRIAYTNRPLERAALVEAEYLIAQRARRTEELSISNPSKDHASGKTLIHFARPILDARGGFAGTIALSVSPEVLTHVYESLKLGPKGVLGLRRLDNTLFIRLPEAGVPGTKLAGASRMARGVPEGSEIRPGGIDGIERVFSYQRISHLPFYAVVGQPLDTVLGEYREERWVYLCTASLLSMVAVWFALALLSKLKHEEIVEAALRQSEARFRSLTGLASDMYWEQDAEHRYTAVAGAGPDWMTMRAAELVGKHAWDFPYLNMTEAAWAAQRARLDARKPFQDLELCRPGPCGHKVWVSVSGEPVFDASGAFSGYRGVGKDITSRKRDESLLKLEHAVARHLADAESVAAGVEGVMRAICETEGWDAARYFRWDEATGMLRFGEGWTSLNGAPIEEFIATSRKLTRPPGEGLIGQTFQLVQPHWVADTDTDPRVVQKGIGATAGLHGAFFFPVVSRSKAIGVLAFNSREVREPDERLLEAVKVIGSMLGQFLKRQQGEDELRRFRTAMNASEDMVWLIDPECMTILDVNDTACRKLGYAREELLKKGPHDIIAMTRDDLSKVYARLVEGSDSGAVIESWYHRKDGTRFPVEAYRRAMRSNDRDVIIAVVRDVTERRAAEEELRRFRLAMDSSQDVIVLIDRASMRFIDVNRTACRLLGYSREEMLRMGPHDILPVTRQELERDYDALIAHPTDDTEAVPRGMRSEYTRKDGSTLPFESTRHVLRSGTATIIAAIARDISARLAIEEKVAYLAQFDALTGLPNRNLFQDRLAQAMALSKRGGRPMAVLFIDLDRFKLVNDTQGHSAGDKLLKEAAERLRNCVRLTDTVGRLGGDEFAAILSELGKPADAGLVAQKFIEVLRSPFVVEGKETYVSASVGITLYPADSESAEQLIMNADAAMYRAKDQGRNNYQYFTRDMNERALKRVQVEGALRRALERAEFRLEYQPKAHLRTGKICGFEALLRWKHPDRGIVSPGEFIPVLEETGLIVPVGEWVLRSACQQIRAWRGKGFEVPPVSVNLSARQFEQKNLKDAVHRVLAETGVPPSLIEFEITESLLMHDPEGAARTLGSLKESGVRLSMDDFGTGYSSLGYLKRFPIDTLKIDRTFVHDISTNADGATLTRAIIHLAQNLRLKVVAEGVETEEQLAFLRANGCDEMQGYLFARPTSAEECERMMNEGHSLPTPSGLRRAGARLKRV